IRYRQVRFALATARAVLRRVRAIHGSVAPAGPCCLPGDQAPELTPRGVIDALGEASNLDHARRANLFCRDEIKLVDEAAAVLVRNVLAFPLYAHSYVRAATLRRC